MGCNARKRNNKQLSRERGNFAKLSVNERTARKDITNE
jgi:hypothetical protein